MEVVLSGKVTTLIPLSVKAFLSTVVTELGIVNSPIEVLSQKARLPIVVMLPDKVMLLFPAGT